MGIEKGPSTPEKDNLEALRLRMAAKAIASRVGGEARFSEKFDAAELRDEDLYMLQKAIVGDLLMPEFNDWRTEVHNEERKLTADNPIQQHKLSSRGQFMAFLSGSMEHIPGDKYRLMKGALPK